MKEFSKKIGAILMSLVVIFSTMSFTISQHYCGGEVFDSALFSKVDSCNMDEKDSSIIVDCNSENENCCDNVTKVYEGQNELETDILNLNHNPQMFIASFVFTYVNLFEGLDTHIVPFKNYIQPLLVSDIQIIDQVFLI